MMIKFANGFPRGTYNLIRSWRKGATMASMKDIPIKDTPIKDIPIEEAVKSLLLNHKEEDITAAIKQYEESAIEAELAAVLEKFNDVPFNVYKDALKKVYYEKQTKKPTSAYMQFVQETLPIIRANFPTLSRKEHLRMVQSHWKIHKS